MRGEEAERLAEGLLEIHRLLKRSIQTFLDREGLPWGRVIILRQLGDEGGLTVSELSRRIGQSKGHVSVLVEQMAAEGLVRKAADPLDQRLVRLHLTDRAQEVRAGLQRKYRRFLAGLLAELPPEVAEAMTSGLQHLRTTLTNGNGEKEGA